MTWRLKLPRDGSTQNPTDHYTCHGRLSNRLQVQPMGLPNDLVDARGIEGCGAAGEIRTQSRHMDHPRPGLRIRSGMLGTFSETPWRTRAYKFGSPTLSPVATKDWKPYIDKLNASGARGVLISLWGNNLRDFIKQAKVENCLTKGCDLRNRRRSRDLLALGFIDMPIGV